MTCDDCAHAQQRAQELSQSIITISAENLKLETLLIDLIEAAERYLRLDVTHPRKLAATRALIVVLNRAKLQTEVG